MKGDQISRREFVCKSGQKVMMRSIEWGDLDLALEFINNLVSEKLEDPGFGIITDQKQTRESEARWLSTRLAEIESGEAIHICAISKEKIVGNCGVTRGKANDELHHGTLGISVAREFRDNGIGRELLNFMLEECKKEGLKTIELEAFANNLRAIHLYESVGFKIVGVIPKKMCRNGNFYDATVMALVL